MNCKSCGRSCFGGTLLRQQSQLCYTCWRHTPDGRMKHSANRAKRVQSTRSLAHLTVGTRVRKVKLELFNNRTPPQEGVIVEEPVHVGGNNWQATVRWDGRSRTEKVNTQRLKPV